MWRWLLVSSQQTETGLSRDEVVSRFPDPEDLSDAHPDMEWEYETSSRFWRHRLRISACPPKYEVVEERYVSWIWYLACFVAYTAIAVFDGTLIALTGGISFIGLFAIVLSREGPLGGFWESSGSTGVDEFPLILLLIVLVGVLTLDLALGAPDVLVAAFSVVLFSGYWAGEQYIIDFSGDWQRRFVGWADRLPHVVIDYPLFVLMMSGPLFLVSLLSCGLGCCG